MKLKTLLTVGLLASLSLPAVHASVGKSKRRLVIVSELTKFGMSKYEWLYKFLDANTISMAKMMMGNKYESIRALAGDGAEKHDYVNALKYYTNLSNTAAVDTIMSVHGSDNKLWFRDGSVTTNDLKNDIISGVPKRSKLRLMYNLACFGSTHNNEFIASGYRTSIGSLKTNTASASEYPVFLTRFGNNHHVKSIIDQTNADPGMFISDNAAKLMGFSNVNSKKYIQGNKYLTINHNAN